MISNELNYYFEDVLVVPMSLANRLGLLMLLLLMLLLVVKPTMADGPLCGMTNYADEGWTSQTSRITNGSFFDFTAGK
jgi:hypothetical protein